MSKSVQSHGSPVPIEGPERPAELDRAATLPQVRVTSRQSGGLDLTDGTFYCYECGSMASMKTCPHGKEDRRLLSGTMLRKTLSEGGGIPKEFSKPEVLDILREYYSNLEEKVEIKLRQAATGEVASDKTEQTAVRPGCRGLTNKGGRPLGVRQRSRVRACRAS